jgi:hypothetical protein
MGHLLTILQKARILFRDSFNRPDAATLGTPWAYYGVSTWGILNNKAYSNDTAGSATSACWQAPTANEVVSVSVTFGTNEGLSLRLSDATNHIAIRLGSTSLGVFRIVTGTPTQIGTYAFTPVAGTAYALKAICNGSTIRVFLNGLEVITITGETFNLTSTLFGLRSVSTNAATTGKFDDFVVEAVA